MCKPDKRPDNRLSVSIGFIGGIIAMLLIYWFASYLAGSPRTSNSCPGRLVTIAGILTPARLAETTIKLPPEIKNAELDLLYIRVYEDDKEETAGFVFNSRSEAERKAIYKHEMHGTKLCLIPTSNEVPMFILLEPHE
ncbi:MAG: hypothetical protein UT02_C0047G0003 [Parcubacteria group bacterium GW2011_GWC2_38_7]|nr:MAG: hypothetical protein UT02_C0047G0003 [Parcubacteria group bacterium GW2011_GWC2_38_7]